MLVECLRSGTCEQLCAQNRSNRALILDAREQQEAHFASKAKNLGHLLDHPEVVLPDHIQAAEAEDFTAAAHAANRLKAVGDDFNASVAAIGSYIVNEACDLCPTRQLDLTPLPTQE